MASPTLDRDKDKGFVQSGHSPVKVEMKIKDRLDVRDFGAKGNGLDDDREAIRNAVDYAISGGGGPVYFGPGKYRLMPSPWWWRAFRSIQRKILHLWYFKRWPRLFRP